MSVAFNDRWKQQTASGGETSLNYDFPVQASGHMVVARTRSGVTTILTETTHYTVNNVGETSGTITLNGTATPAVAADVYTMYSSFQPARSADFTQSGDYLAATINDQLDLLWMQIQDLYRTAFDRTLFFSEEIDLSSFSTELPDPDTALQFLRINSAATGLEFATIAAADTVTAGDGLDLAGAVMSFAPAGATALGASPALADVIAMADVGSSNAIRKVTFQEVFDAIDRLADLGAAMAGDDKIPVWDETASAVKSVQRDDFPFPLGYRFGGTLSNNGVDADHDIDIAAGAFRGADDDENIVLSALTKRIDATWAAGTGNGGLSSSLTAPGNNTWYHVFAIKVAGAADVGFDTSITAANLVADHSATAYRRLGSVLTDGTANILAFVQVGDTFIWDVPIENENNVTATADAVTVTMSTPLGVVTECIFVSRMGDTYAVWSPLAITDTSPSQTGVALGVGESSGGTATSVAHEFRTLTNTSSQIRRHFDSSTSAYTNTVGWRDFLGD